VSAAGIVFHQPYSGEASPALHADQNSLLNLVLFYLVPLCLYLVPALFVCSLGPHMGPMWSQYGHFLVCLVLPRSLPVLVCLVSKLVLTWSPKWSLPGPFLVPTWSWSAWSQYGPNIVSMLFVWSSPGPYLPGFYLVPSCYPFCGSPLCLHLVCLVPT
jgi:hypothetical protein